jgi:predicted transcriptional regulator
MKLLLSIKPKYSRKILSGEKKYEFRKQRPKRVIDRVFIYESSPSNSIVGCFSVRRIHSGSPEEIWRRCKNWSGIERNNYLTYCNGTKVIHALEIEETFRFDNPINPFKMLSDFKPPQSYAYLDGSSLFEALEKVVCAECI